MFVRNPAQGDSGISTSSDIYSRYSSLFKYKESAPALNTQRGSFSYKQINDLLEALAPRLRAKGVSQGDFVAIRAALSPESIAAQLAVLCVGGIVIPLDDSEPKVDLKKLGIPGSTVNRVSD